MAGGNAEGRFAAAAFPGLKLKVSWSSGTEFIADPFQCVAASGGRIFAIGKTTTSLPNQRLFAFDGSTGSLLWQSDDIPARTNYPDNGRMCPAVDGSRVFAGGRGVILAFDTATGAELWSQSGLPTNPLDPPFSVAAPFTARDGAVYAAGFYDTATLDQATGTVLRTNSEGSQSALRVSPSQVVALAGGGVTSRDSTTGSIAWRLSATSDARLDPSLWYWYPAFAMFGDTTYVAKARSVAGQPITVQAIGPDGGVLWTATEGGYRTPRSVTVSEGAVFVAYPCMDGYCGLFPSRVVAYNRSTGASIWSATVTFENQEPRDGVPLVTVLASVVWAGDKFLNAATGEDVGAPTGWPSPVGYTQDSRLFAFGEGEVFGFARSDSTMRVARWVTDDRPDAGTPGGSTPGGDGSGAPNTGAPNPGAPNPGAQECRVPPAGPVGVSINDGARFTDSTSVTLSAVWPACSQTLLISNDGGFRSARSSAIAEGVPWTLDSSGPERLPKTVYLRFNGAGANYTDDIILDEISPVITSVTAATASGANEMSTGRRYRFVVAATDKVSGVGKVQISGSRRGGGTVARYKRVTSAKLTTKQAFVRVQDRAGNWSSWKKVALP